MGVKIVNREYTEIYNTDSVNWLLGNAGDWQKLNVQIEAAIEFEGSQSEPIEISEDQFILVNGKGWQEYGFDIGLIITLSFNEIIDDETNGGKTNYSLRFEIKNIYGEVMEVEAEDPQTQNQLNKIVEEYGLIPSDRGSKRVRDVVIFSEQELEGIKVRYGHIANENSESLTLSSLVDGSVTEFVRPGINNDSVNQFKNMDPIGIQSGMSIRSMRVKKINAPVSQTQPQATFIGLTANFRLEVASLFGTIGFDVSYRSLPLLLRDQFANHQTQQEDVIPVSQNPGTNGDLLNGNPGQCFINNIQGALAQTYVFRLVFQVNGAVSSINNDKLSMVLIRYNDSSGSLVPSGEIELKSWVNANSLVGQTIKYNDEVQIFGNENEYYSLCLKYEHAILGEANASRYIDIGNFGGAIYVFPLAVGTEDYKKYYEIEIQYLVNGMLFEPEDFDNINQAPGVLFNDGSLTDNFIFELFPKWNNPNTAIKNDLKQTARLGNTGWFNENFNQLDNDFSVESIKYLDNEGNILQALDFASDVTAEIEISGLRSFSPSTELGFGFFWVPENTEDYKNKKNPQYRLLYLSNGSYDDGYRIGFSYPNENIGAGVMGASLNTDRITVDRAGDNVVLSVRFKPTLQFASVFNNKPESDRRYIVFVSIGEPEAQRNFNNRVSLIADFNSLQKSTVSQGEYNLISSEFLEHPYDENTRGVDLYRGFVQDGVLARLPFQIEKNRDLRFEYMTFGVEVVRNEDSFNFELESTNIDLTSFPIDSSGIQQFNVDTTRGFKLENGNNKNWIKIKRQTSLDTSERNGYIAFYAFKIRWEDWISNENAPGDFFDSNLENNGLNNDWVGYLRKEGWGFNFYVSIGAVLEEENVLFRNAFPIEFNDYDENILIDTVIEYKNASGDVLNIGTDLETGRPLGVILQNEETFIEISYVILDLGVWDLNKHYAITTIEIDRGAGSPDQRQLSSVWGSEADNPLKPITGETKLKMEVLGSGKILKTTCKVDPLLLDESNRYRVTGRIGCFEGNNDTINLGLYERRYENLYE